MKTEQHFVVFLSPGTFVNEVTEKKISSWDVDKAVQMASKVTERYGATPFGFYFVTKGLSFIGNNQKAKSNMYYLGGEVLTLRQVKARKNPKDKTLIWNMETNKIDRVLENTNSWKVALPLEKGDVVLPYEAPKRARSDND